MDKPNDILIGPENIGYMGSVGPVMRHRIPVTEKFIETTTLLAQAEPFWWKREKPKPKYYTVEELRKRKAERVTGRKRLKPRSEK